MHGHDSRVATGLSRLHLNWARTARSFPEEELVICKTGRTRATGTRRHAGVVTPALLLLLGILPVSAVAQTYYVDAQCPTCSASGPGTEAEPYCTIMGAVSAHQGPGVVVVVKPGLYRELVTVSASGTSTSPFVIRAAGPGVVLDGTDDFAGETRWAQPAAATLSGAGSPQVLDYAWLAHEVNWKPHQVFVNGRRLSSWPGEPELMPAEAFRWVKGEGLYVNVGGENPGSHDILVGRRANAFRIAGQSWVVIEGFEITRADDSAINVFPGCSDIQVARNRITFSESYGVKVAGSERVRVEENSVSEGTFHGIGLTAGSSGCVVHGNEAFRNELPGLRVAKGIYVAASPNNILEGNRTYENQDSGIQINPGSHFCLLFNNQSWRNGDHGFDHLDAIGTIHVNDVAFGNHMDGFSIEGDSPGAQVFNCISYDNGLTTGRFNLWVNAASTVDFRSDYNILWNSNGQEPVKFSATKYLWLGDYTAASGQDAHSIQANPLLTDPRKGNFVPLQGSPAIDAGNSAVQYWPAYDDAGHMRYDDPTTPDQGVGPVTYSDIGAIEFVRPLEEGPVALPNPNFSPSDRLRSPFDAGQVSEARGVTLSGASPNPSRGPVEFALDLPGEARVEWAVYDLQGRTVWSEALSVGPGRSQLRWTGMTSTGQPAATGVYLVRARAAGTQFTRRLIRL